MIDLRSLRDVIVELSVGLYEVTLLARSRRPEEVKAP